MHKRNLKFAAPLAVVSAALLGGFGGLAAAAGTRTKGEVHIYEADTSLAGNRGTVILTGAITDHGTDHQGDPVDDTNRLVLSKGSFSINVAGAGNTLAALPLNPRTCSSDGTVTAPLPIIPGTGTGAYRGISGTFETTVSDASILPRRRSGECNTSASKFRGPLIANGSGTVTYK